MQTIAIRTFQQLDKWLSDYDYFEEVLILEVKANPVEIIVGYESGYFDAYLMRDIIRLKIVPEGILEWNYDDAVMKANNNYISGIYLLEVESGICLEISETARLHCNSITVEQLEKISVMNQPWAEDKRFSWSAKLDFIPKPEFWINALADYGHNVSFRYYSCGLKKTPEVPYPDYQGYYLQEPGRIPVNQEGIFIPHLTFDSGRVRGAFEKKDPELEKIWIDLANVIGNLQDSTVYCGNCRFTGAEWIEYLENGTFPPKKQ